MHPADQQRARFITDLIGDSLAPTNTLLGNPAAIKRLYETGGASLWQGLQNAYDDLRNNGGMPRQVDERPFKIGENVANSKGAVVFKTEMLDQVFAISWRNPGRQHAHWGLEEYVTALIEASDAVKKITRSPRLNVTGACSGGITMALFLSELAARGDDRVNAPNDLIWNYVVNNYLLGESPPPFDVLFWNNDGTNLPAQLHSDYLDIFQDRRFRPDKEIEFMGHDIDLGSVTQDCFMVAGITDHITPWKACYRNIRLFGGEVKSLGNKAHPPLSQAPGEYIFT